MDRFLSRLKPIRCTKFIAFFKIVVSPRKVSKGKRGNHDFKKCNKIDKTWIGFNGRGDDFVIFYVPFKPLSPLPTTPC